MSMASDELRDAEAARIKRLFIAARGYWRPWTESMLRVCPAFVEQYAAYAGHPSRNGPLSPRMVELIYVALDSSASHLFESGLQTHMKKALEVGATEAEIFDVLHLVAVQGAVATCEAASILDDLTGADEQEVIGSAVQARIDALGSAHALPLTAVARMDPAYAEVLLDFIEKGRPSMGLAPLEQSLVQLALHACFTAFNPQATRQMISKALSQGASRAELLQAIQLGSHLAVHGAALGANVFRQLREPAAAPASDSTGRPEHHPGPI